MYRKNTFITLMNSYNDVLKVTESNYNSQGVAMQKQEIYERSLTASIKGLQAEWEKFWKDSLDIGIIQGVIDSITGLISVFGNLGTILLSAGTALMFWKGNALLGVVKGLKDFSLTTKLATSNLQLFKTISALLELQEMGLQTTTQTLSLSFVALGTSIKSVFLSNPLGWIALGITAFVTFANSIETATERIEKHNKEIEKLESSKTEIEGLKKSYIELSSKAQLTDEEHQNLLNTQNKLAELSPELVDHYDAQGNAILKGKEAIDEYIQSLKEKQLQEEQDKRSDYLNKIREEENSIRVAKNHFGSNADKNPVYNNLVKESNDKISEYRENLKKGIEEFSKLEGISSKIVASIGKSTIDTKFKKLDSGNIDDYVKKWNELSNSVKTVNFEEKLTEYQKLNEKLANGSVTVGDVKIKYKELFDLLKNSGVSSKDIELFLPSVGSLNSLKDLKNEVDELPPTFDSATSKLADFNKYLKELNDNHRLSGDSIKYIIKNYPELIGFLGNEKKLRKELSDTISDEEEIQSKTFLDMVKNDTDYYNNKLKTNVELVNKLKDNYNIDLDNYANLEQAKIALSEVTTKKINEMYATSIGSTLANTIKNLPSEIEKAGIGGLGDLLKSKGNDIGKFISETNKNAEKIKKDAFLLDGFIIADFKKLNINSTSDKTKSSSPSQKQSSTTITEKNDPIVHRISDINDTMDKESKTVKNLIDNINTLLKLGDEDSLSKALKEQKKLISEYDKQVEVLKKSLYDMTNGKDGVSRQLVGQMVKMFPQLKGKDLLNMSEADRQDLINKLFPKKTFTDILGKDGKVKISAETQKSDYEKAKSDLSHLLLDDVNKYKENVEKINEALKQVKNNKIDATKELQDISDKLDDIELERDNNIKTIIKNHANDVLNEENESIDKLKTKLEDAKNDFGSLDLKTDADKEKVVAVENEYIEALRKSNSDLQNQLDLLENLDEKGSDAWKTLSKQIEQNNRAISDAEKDIVKINKETTDSMVSAYETLYDKITEAVRKQRENAKDEELRANQKHLDDLKKEYEGFADETGKIVGGIFKPLNDEITKLEGELKDLQSGFEEKETGDKEAQLKKELIAWSRGTDALSKTKVGEIQKQLDELDKDKQIKAKQKEIDTKKEEIKKVEEEYKNKQDYWNNKEKEIQTKYEELLKDASIYKQVNEEMKKSQTEIVNFLLSFDEKYKQAGGKLADAFVDEMKTKVAEGIKALEVLKAIPPTTNTTDSKSYNTSKTGVINGENADEYYVKFKKLLGFDSGGYTGNGQGIAMLHEKELILNQFDTSNMLKAIDFTRQIVNNLKTPKLSIPNIMNNTSKESKVEINQDFNIVNNTPFDVENNADSMNRNIKNLLQKTGALNTKLI